MPDNLMLYITPTCPFCRKVLSFMESKSLDVPSRDISANPDYRDALVALGGKAQVPCLVIDGKALYESDDIIQWMKNNLT